MPQLWGSEGWFARGEGLALASPPPSLLAVQKQGGYPPGSCLALPFGHRLPHWPCSSPLPGRLLVLEGLSASAASCPDVRCEGPRSALYPSR